MIERVTVYRRGARVRRSVAIDPPASVVRRPDRTEGADANTVVRRPDRTEGADAKTVVTLAGLPLALDDASVRVRVDGAGARAAAVRISVEEPPADATLAPARDEERDAAERDLAGARAEVARLEATLARFEALAVVPRPRPRKGEPPSASPAEVRLSLARARASESLRVSEELAAARRRARDAERRFDELRDRARRASTARNALRHELRKRADIELEGATEAGARLLFEYVVPGASWSPAYAVWLDDATARVAMRAVVAQHTGEDWAGVWLVLSTADPDRWSELPELAKLRIGRVQPVPAPRGFREPPEGARELYADYDRAFLEERGRGPEQERGSPLDVAAGEEVTSVLGETTVAKEPATKKGEIAFDEGRTRAPGSMTSLKPVLSEAHPAAPPPPAAPPMLVAGAPMSFAGAASFEPQAPAKAGFGAFRRARGRSAAVVSRPPVPPPLPPSFQLDLEQMAYARLRMFPADDARRGDLSVIAVAEAYAEGAHLSVDVGVAIRIAIERAEAIAALPAAHAPPDAPDAFDYAFTADVVADIPSDGQFHVVPVTEYSLPSRASFVAVPGEASDVFRQVRIDSPDAALLAGPADVYAKRGGEDVRRPDRREGADASTDVRRPDRREGADADTYVYLLTTQMPATPPGAEVTLGLGVEQAIKIARNATFTEQAAGLLGNRLDLVHDVAVDLKNNLPRAITVEVRERVPVKRKDDDDIEIDLGPVEPAWESWTQDDSLQGGHRWKVDVGPGASRTLKARYTVRISAKQQLVGGNRREA
jgi:hypothetical protein